MQRFRRTRIAPTPSGFLHLGNAFSFAVTAWLAQQTKAALLLRIDDLDRERVRPAYKQDIFDTLDFLKIEWQEGPRDVYQFETMYSQHSRETLYKEALQQLAEEGKLFACECSRSQLGMITEGEGYPGTCRDKNIPLDTPGTSWRLRTGQNAAIKMNTLDKGVVDTILPAFMHDFIVRKKDGHASYQLASVCDDAHFGVDLIVRGEDLYDSTLAQLYLANELHQPDFTAATFYHHPLLEWNKRKLSKSAGDTSIRYLRNHQATAANLYGMIGKMLQLPADISDWHLLGNSFWATIH